jgi:predicted TIM-barrel fold metal-dependent hydrolase
MRSYKVISADGHVEVPIDFPGRVPAKFKDLVPHLMRRDDGTEYWQMGEFTRENIGNLYCDLAFNEFTPQNTKRYHFNDGSSRPGTGDAVQRLREQDKDGIDAEVLFFPIFGPAFLRKLLPANRDAYLACVQAYNTFLAQEYCAVAPDRLIGNAMVPESGVDDAIAEMARCRKMGLRAVSLTMWPNGGPDPKPELDDRFWAALLDSDTRLAPHVNFGGPIHAAESPTVEMAVSGSGATTMTGGTIGRLILHGTFERFPKLKMYFAETQCSWLIHALNNRLDEVYLRWHAFYGLKLKKLPSEYWREHCMFGFIIDHTAMKLRDYIGTDMMAWGSDFPHSMGTYPVSREMVGEMFEGVPETDRNKVLVDNMVQFYGLDTKRELTPTP